MIDASGNCQRSYEAKISSEKARQARIDRENNEMRKKAYYREYNKFKSWGMSDEEAKKRSQNCF